nr:alpha-L-arabinofuranosidase C-terminal domain-containing protein [Paenibacillus dendrobii]
MVHIGSFSDLVNGWLGGCIRVGDYYADQYCGKENGWSGLPLTVYGTPTYEVLKLYANRDIRRILPVDTVCSTYSIQSPKQTRIELEALPDLDVTACANEDGSILTLFIVNRSLQEVTAELDLHSLEYTGDTRLYEITGDSYEDINSVFEPDLITCTSRTVPVSAWQQGYPLRATSVYAVEIKAQHGSGGKV